MTPAEEKLWRRLQGRRLCGLKFRRQEPIGPYIPDFYSPDILLVVELDGGAHFLTAEHDKARQEALEALEITVMRFTNGQVLGNLPHVLGEIKRYAESVQPGICGRDSF